MRGEERRSTVGEVTGARSHRNWKVFGVCFEFDVKLESFEKKNLTVNKIVLAAVLSIQSLGGRGWHHRPVRRLLQESRRKVIVAWPGVLLVGVVKDVHFWLYSKAGVDGIC